MKVRVLSRADGATWHALLTEGTARYPWAFLMSSAEVAAMSAGRIDAAMDSGSVFGLFDGARMIGIAGLRISDLCRMRHRASLGPFYVIPEAQGTGAADRFLSGLVGVARGQGADWIDLWVAASNGRARAFYARHGFVECGVRVDAVRIDGRSEDDIAMALRLEAATPPV
ncbi:GNAT family N-acetyltransferase [Jannaschia sp. S6380]|uniref:GNAT family N-acetyltransferase n=1 Tax=Jannaschia sp. S6380 TaxID=2926408 RepID=UPI001FF2F2C0|nr:GNAT family N-acetyltransferase [Jannaschia sp. S6380]MCK0167359.1 GNAT family N-acetyltransferase [Jannaschia sp. S6380]